MASQPRNRENVRQLRRQLQPLLLEDVQETGKELGRGSYGVVYEVTVSGLQCAGKKLHEFFVEDGGDLLIDKFGQECLLHSQQRHPNIVQLMGVHYLPCAQLPLLVMEYLPISLAQCLDKHQKARQDLPLQIKYSILLDVAKGLNYLHRKRPRAPIVHRDLSANNILLTTNYMAKISDLGMSRMIDTYRRQQQQTHALSKAPGTTSVMPPEALKDNPKYDHKLDVFSYGCLVLHVFSQQWPIPTNEYVPSTTIQGMFKKVPEWQRRSMYAAKIPKDNSFLQLSKSCLEDEPESRPEISYVLERTQHSLSACPPLKNILELMDENTAQLEQLQKEKEAKGTINEEHMRELTSLEEYYRKELQEREQQLERQKRESREKERALQEKERELQLSHRQLEENEREKEREVQEKTRALQQLQEKERLSQLSQEKLQQVQNQWVIQRDEVTLTEELLGKGAYGHVTVGVFRGLRVAVKSLHDLIICDYNLALFTREMEMAALVRHPNLVQFIGATKVGSPLIVTELMSTSLYHELQRKALTRPQIVSIGRDVALGLNYLHLWKPEAIIHRCVCSPNILLEPSVSGAGFKAKVGDYGTVIFKQQARTEMPGNPAYAAPESRYPDDHSPLMDVYSYCVLLMVMSLHKRPAMTVRERAQQAVSLSSSWSAMQSLVQSGLNIDRTARPTMAQILKTLNGLL